MDEYYSIVGTDHILFIYSSVDGHLTCLDFWATDTNAAVNTGVQASVRLPVVDCLEHTPRSGISRSYDNSIK